MTLTAGSPAEDTLLTDIPHPRNSHSGPDLGQRRWNRRAHLHNASNALMPKNVSSWPRMPRCKVEVRTANSRDRKPDKQICRLQFWNIVGLDLEIVRSVTSLGRQSVLCTLYACEVVATYHDHRDLVGRWNRHWVELELDALATTSLSLLDLVFINTMYPFTDPHPLPTLHRATS